MATKMERDNHNHQQQIF